MEKEGQREMGNSAIYYLGGLEGPLMPKFEQHILGRRNGDLQVEPKRSLSSSQEI